MGMRLNPHCTPERAHQEVDTISDTCTTCVI
jgi:hypothetical protein